MKENNYIFLRDLINKRITTPTRTDSQSNRSYLYLLRMDGGEDNFQLLSKAQHSYILIYKCSE